MTVTDSSPAIAPAPDGSFSTLWTDGAARGNPGPAGIGVMLKGANGEVIVAEGQFVGHTTNNVAEYKALLLGLERALERGVARLEVRADSELLIKQLKGEYRVRNPGLLPLYEEAKRLLRRFEEFRLQHVRREHNGEADRLANEGIDQVGRTGG
jgi:ribonuclease HI